MIAIDDTHDAKIKSWIVSANDPACDFPVQNLPLGVFRRRGAKEAAHIGAAIGDRIVDLAALAERGLLEGQVAEACRADALNALMALGRARWTELRRSLSRLLREHAGQQAEVAICLVAMSEADMLLPARIGDFTDFYTSINHAINAGRLFRPDNPLMPNFKSLPVAYHGRASSVAVSGTPCRRPLGQSRGKDAPSSEFGPSRRLDYEMEIGVYVGPGNALGEPVPLARAEEHLFGVCLVNDWSARDIQAWEYQPLGPFLGKSFLTSVSPWVVSLDALAPFRSPATRPASDPALLPYLQSDEDSKSGGLDILLECHLQTGKMRAAGIAPVRIARAPFAGQYWTLGQMLAHHASNGCNLQSGDMIGSGTISGSGEGEQGCLLEMTLGGSKAIELPGGEKRTFLEDGDEVVFRGSCSRPGFARIGLGECRGMVTPAHA